MSQTLDMSWLPVIPTKHPKTTSATWCNPRSMPMVEDEEVMAAAMTTAAVTGA